jgi:hypothetical protein
VQRTKSGDLDTDQAVCVLKPGASMIRDRYALDLTTTPPGGRSPWSGMSGAAVFADGLLMGVVVGDPSAWQHGRLEAVPGALLLGDSAFVSTLTDLAGASPRTAPLLRRSSRSSPHPPLSLAGIQHETPRALAATIRSHWYLAQRTFFERMGSPSAPSEGWLELRNWLRALGDANGRAELIDQHLTSENLPPEMKLLRLLHWLDPDGAPVYLGRPVTDDSLLSACVARQEPEIQEDRLLRDALLNHELLNVLAGFPGFEHRRKTQGQWNRIWARWRQEAGDHAPADARLPALLTVLDVPDARAALRREARSREEPPRPVRWYDEMLAAVGGRETPLGEFTRWMCAQAALDDYRAAEERQRREREQHERNRRRKENRLAQERRRAEEALVKEQKRKAEREQREQERQLLLPPLLAAIEERRRLRNAWFAVETRKLTPNARAGAAMRAAAWHTMWGLLVYAAYWLSWGIDDPPSSAQWMALQIGSFTAFWAAFGIRRAWGLGLAYRPPFLRPWAWLPPSEELPNGAARALGIGCALTVQSWLTSHIDGPDPGPWSGDTPDMSHTLWGTAALTVYAVLCVAVVCRVPGLRRWEDAYLEAEQEVAEMARECSMLEGHAAKARTAFASSMPNVPAPLGPDTYKRLRRYLRQAGS